MMLCEQRYMEVLMVKQKWPCDWSGILVSFVQQLEESCSNVHWNSHDDALRHSWKGNTDRSTTCRSKGGKFSRLHTAEVTADRVLLSKVGSVKQMVGGFLKGGQHEDALLHLCQSESGDS